MNCLSPRILFFPALGPFHSTNSSRKLLTITYGDTTKSTEQDLLTNRRINCCISEEPDARLV